MRIVLSSDGSVELLRGERVRRGQDLSRRIYVEWNENESPIDTGQILADNMAVQLCITRPDGEQSGWYSMIKIDAEDKYYYTLQAWDTAVTGIATVVVRWHDITIAEENRPEYPSDEASFIVDNGKIAQPLNISSENYNEIVLQFITPLSAQAFRKYNVNALPDTITYSADGEKTAPALFYNFTHEVDDYESGISKKKGMLFVNVEEERQMELFVSADGKLYVRSFLVGDTAETFKNFNTEYAVEAHHFRKVILDENTPIDFNEFLECGHYGVNDKLAKSSKNIPDTAGGTLTVSSFFTSHPNTDSKWAYRSQEYFNRNGRWFRSEALKEDGSHNGWTDWKHFVINEDLTEYQKTIDNSLNTESKKIPEAINEVNTNKAPYSYVDEKFNGANKAVAFASYENLVNELLITPKEAYRIGQNMYIWTLSVPDLWVAGVVESYVPYSYTTDEAFIEEIKNLGGYVQVGYYRLAMLETQKVDLIEYQKIIDDTLETESKEIVGAINEVDHKSRLDVFDGLERMLNSLYYHEEPQLVVGQRIHIEQYVDFTVTGILTKNVGSNDVTTAPPNLLSKLDEFGRINLYWYELTANNLPSGGEAPDLIEYQKIIDDTLETESKEIVGAINELFHKSEFLQFDSLQLMEDEFYHESEPKYGVGTRIRVENIELVITKILSEFDDNPPYPGGDENAINYFIEALNSGKVDYFWYELTAVAPDLSEYVKFTDVATRDKYGLSKAGAGLYNNSGTYMVYPASDSEIENFSSFYGPITTTKIPLAVKAGLTKTNIEWTEEEKASARELLGISGGGSGGGKLYKHMVNITCADNDLAPINSFTFTFISSESRDITQILGYGDTKRTITFNEFASYILVNEVDGEMVEEWSSCIIYSLSGSTTETSLDYPVRYNYKGAIHTAIAYAMDDTVTEV